MDANEVQRKTELAKVMVENGLAANINEALDQIENSNLIKEEIQQEAQEQPLESDRLKKIEKVLDDFGNYFMRFKDNINVQIQDLKKDILASNSSIEELQRRITQIKIHARPEEPKQEQKTLAKDEPENKSSEKNQRVGEWTSEDVQIDEIFSNAHGKMMKKK